MTVSGSTRKVGWIDHEQRHRPLRLVDQRVAARSDPPGCSEGCREKRYGHRGLAHVTSTAPAAMSTRANACRPHWSPWSRSGGASVSTGSGQGATVGRHSSQPNDSRPPNTTSSRPQASARRASGGAPGIIHSRPLRRSTNDTTRPPISGTTIADSASSSMPDGAPAPPPRLADARVHSGPPSSGSSARSAAGGRVPIPPGRLAAATSTGPCPQGTTYLRAARGDSAARPCSTRRRRRRPRACPWRPATGALPVHARSAGLAECLEVEHAQADALPEARCHERRRRRLVARGRHVRDRRP